MMASDAAIGQWHWLASSYARFCTASTSITVSLSTSTVPESSIVRTFISGIDWGDGEATASVNT